MNSTPGTMLDGCQRIEGQLIWIKKNSKQDIA